MKLHFSRLSITLVATCSLFCAALDLNTTDQVSIRRAASTVAYDLMSYYTGNITNTPDTIAILPPPLYWWEAGALWGAMVDYYHLTNDSSYVDVTTQALVSQVGPLFDYMVPSHQSDEGNDDQAFWGFATMSAAEKDYPQPTFGQYSWLQLTENLWNTQVRRWDTTQCDGGLKWQIFPSNQGYFYKNSVSNGAFFQLSARLARFTGNQTYYDWALKSYDWSARVGLIDMSSQYSHMVWDGTDANKGCIDQNRIVWSYNAGIYIYGAAVLYNYTNGSSTWQERTEGFLNATAYFFNPGGFTNTTDVMYEPSCEIVNNCNNDQYAFKGLLSRFMWASSLLAPFTSAAITTLLTSSAIAAARACSGGNSGTQCGQHWYWETAYDRNTGVGQQMSALETIQGLLTPDATPPIHSDQVHLLLVATTSQAPVPTQTRAAPGAPSAPSAASSSAAAVDLKASKWLCGVGVVAAFGVA